MELYKRTGAEVLKAMLDDVDDSYQKTIGYPTYDLLNAAALELARLTEKLDRYASMLDIDNLSGAELERFVYQRRAIRRKEATHATALLTVTGTGTIYKGNLFQTAGGVQYAAMGTVEITGSGEVMVQCTVPGSYGNVPKNTITVMPVTLPGITAVTNEAAANDGYDAETDDSLRHRYYTALKKPATSGNVYHYEKWALEVTGVGGAKVYPLWNGANTVQVVIIDSNSQPASAALVKAVQDHIDPEKSGKGLGEAPIGAYCTVTAATALTINVSVKLVGAVTEALKGAINKSIRDYLASIAFNQAYVSYAKLANAINDTPGVVDYSDLTINGDVRNIQVPDKSVAVLGTVTYV